MTNRAKNISSIFLFGLFLILAMGSLINKKVMFGITEEMIPPDFKEFDGTLLVISQYQRIDKGIKKVFDENYRGAYLIVKETELTGKYADSSIYKYYLSRDVYHSKENEYTSVFYMYDRMKKAKFVTNRTPYLDKMLTSYSTALEAARKK